MESREDGELVTNASSRYLEFSDILYCVKVILLLVGLVAVTGIELIVEQGFALISLPKREEVTRIAIVGCHVQDKPAPALAAYVRAEPDVVLWVGDNVYVDAQRDINVIREGYAKLAARPSFQALRRRAVFVPTWDDHDYGMNNAGKHYRLKEESKEIFRRFWGVEEYVPAERSGVFHARYFGRGERRLQVIMLDGRYNRDDPGAEADTLGAEQWAWLERELRKPARLRLIVSGYQVLLDADTKFETWSKFPRAQSRLFELIRRTEAKGVVFIAGDQHYGEVGRWRGALGYDAIELMFSGINQEEEHVFNSRRVSRVAHAKNSYAYIDVQWEKTNRDPPHLVFQILDADTSEVEVRYRVNLSELE